MTVEERYWDVVDMAAEKVERREVGKRTGACRAWKKASSDQHRPT